MAISQLFLILVILAIFAPSILATYYVVGDDKVWTINFDYQAWARGKMFYVGDNLGFGGSRSSYKLITSFILQQFNFIIINSGLGTHRRVFNYPKGAHNVFKVNGTGFQECSSPLDSVPLISGKDVINLATPGRKWYICGVSQYYLDGGQKLAITVFTSSLVPSPSPTWGYSYTERECCF